MVCEDMDESCLELELKKEEASWSKSNSLSPESGQAKASSYYLHVIACYYIL